MTTSDKSLSRYNYRDEDILSTEVTILSFTGNHRCSAFSSARLSFSRGNINSQRVFALIIPSGFSLLHFTENRSTEVVSKDTSTIRSETRSQFLLSHSGVHAVDLTAK